MSKTLDQTVEKLKNETLYIGAATSYFLIGDFWEYQERIDKITEYYKKTFLNNFKQTERNNRNIIAEIHRISENPEQEKPLKNLCERYLASYDAIQSAREKQNFFEAHPDLRKRKVKKVYDRIDDGERGKIIIIEGYEAGRFWFKSEYERLV